MTQNRLVICVIGGMALVLMGIRIIKTKSGEIQMAHSKESLPFLDMGRFEIWEGSCYSSNKTP